MPVFLFSAPGDVGFATAGGVGGLSCVNTALIHSLSGHQSQPWKNSAERRALHVTGQELAKDTAMRQY